MKYKFIIYMNDDINIDISKIRKKTIIIDSSNYKNISKYLANKRKDVLVINDYIFKNEGKVISVPKGFNFKKEIPSYIYEALECNHKKSFIKVRVNDEDYLLSKALSLYSNMRRNMSVFYSK